MCQQGVEAFLLLFLLLSKPMFFISRSQERLSFTFT